MSETTTPRAGRGRALGRRVDVPHRPAAQADLGGGQAQRARRRPDHLRGSGRPGGRAAREVRRRHRRARRHRRRHASRADRRSRSRSTCRRGSPGMDIASDTTIANLEAVGCTVEAAADTLDRHRAELAARPHRPVRPGRGGRPDRRLRGRAERAAARPRRVAGLTPAQSMRRRVGRTLAGEGYVEVVNFPFIGEADLDRLGLDAADPRRTTLRLANPLSSEEPLMTTTLLPGLLRTVARNVSRGTERPGALRDRTGHPAALRESVRRSCRSTGDRPSGSGTTSTGRSRTSRCTSPSPSAATATAPAGGGQVARPAGATSIETARVVAGALGLELTVRAAVAGALAPRPLRRAARRRGRRRPRR